MQDETEGGIGQVIFKAAATLLVIFGLIGFGFYSAVSQNGIYVVVKYFWNTAKLAINELPNHLEVGPPPGFVREGRKPGEGVTINTLPDDGSRVLLSSFFGAGPGLSLIDRSGATLATWPALFSQHFPDPSKFDGHIPWTDLNIDIHGSYIEPDGSVLFNFEYGGTVKLDRCGKPLWTIAEATHHSIDKAEDGGYWIPSRNYFPAGSTAPDEVFPPFTDVPVPTDFADDLILKVSADGEVVIRKSVMRILYDNGFEPLLTSTGINFYPDVMGRFELLHLNKITELKSSMAEAFPMFQAGDLLLSIRDNNMLVVVDPDDWKVKWHQIGPWIRQHDP
ncbi:MAG: hypothetical protein RLZZ528_2923, partial [Pseudomonadota bacterium]